MMCCVWSQSADELAYIDEVKGYSEAQLRNASAVLLKEERKAHQSGKPPKKHAEEWIFRRKNILYHLLDDRKESARQAAYRKWAKGHDEL